MFQSIMMRELLNLKNPTIIDVREPEEHRMGIIPQAMKIPLNTLPNNKDKLDKSQTYYVVCQSGSRSHAACQYLGNEGYKVVNVLGGMRSYRGPLNR